MELEGGEFFVEFGIFDLSPINQVEVLPGFDEWKNFHAKGCKDEVSVPGAVSGDLGQERGENQKGEGHPPREGGVSQKPSEADEEEEGKGDRGDDDEALGLSGPGEAEFLMGFGDFFGRGHELELIVGNGEGVALVDVAGANSFGEPLDALP